MLYQMIRLPRHAITQYSAQVDITVLSLIHTGYYTLCLKKRDPDIIDCNFGKD